MRARNEAERQKSYCLAELSQTKNGEVAIDVLGEVRSGRDVVPLLGGCEALGKLCDALMETS